MRETSAWISSRIGRVPSSAHATAAPDLAAVGTAEELGGIGDADEAGPGHLEHAELVRGAEPVLDRPQDPVGVVPVALELEHAVDEMLEHARPCDRAVLRHVPDEDRRNALLLGHAKQPPRCLRTWATDPGAEPSSAE